MLNRKQVLAVIPARGGSKGIPRKNLYRLGADTLLERAIKLAQGCKYVDRTVVSTDDSEMFAIAVRYGVNTPNLRPAHLSADAAQTVDVVLHVLDELGLDDLYVLLLQPTSPLRTSGDLSKLCETFEKEGRQAEAIVSLCKFEEPHPDKVQKIEGGYVKGYLASNPLVPRQTLPEVYRLNGAFYLTHTDAIRQKRTFLPDRTIPYIMPQERSVNLDTLFDLHLLEALIEKGIVVVP